MALIENFTGEKPYQPAHPPHLTSSWSSSFIPFCAYKTKLNFTEKSHALNGTNFPLCPSFVPTILEGQLCYKLGLERKSGRGKKSELMLLLDYNEDRSLQLSSAQERGQKTSNDTVNFDNPVKRIQVTKAKVQINTLSPYIGFGGGIYQMAAVKRMSAKDDFLKMPLKDRNCKVEIYEDCRTRHLLEECKCKPLEVPGFEVGAPGY